VKKRKHGHIQPIISEHVWRISTIYSALIDIWVGMINLIFVLRSFKGCCYGNQLIWGTFCKHRNWPLSAFALEFRIARIPRRRYWHRHRHPRWHPHEDRREEVDVGVGVVGCELKGMQYRHLHKGVNTSDNAPTSHKNLVNFGAVTSEITFLICVPSCGYWFSRRSPFVTLAFSNALDD